MGFRQWANCPYSVKCVARPSSNSGRKTGPFSGRAEKMDSNAAVASLAWGLLSQLFMTLGNFFVWNSVLLQSMATRVAWEDFYNS